MTITQLCHPRTLAVAEAQHGFLQILPKLQHPCCRVFIATLAAGKNAASHANLETTMTCLLLSGQLELEIIYRQHQKLYQKVIEVHPMQYVLLPRKVWKKLHAISECQYIILCSHEYSANEYISAISDLPDIKADDFDFEVNI